MIGFEQKKQLNYLFEDFFRMLWGLLYEFLGFMVKLFTGAIKMLFPPKDNG